MLECTILNVPDQAGKYVRGQCKGQWDCFVFGFSAALCLGLGFLYCSAACPAVSTASKQSVCLLWFVALSVPQGILSA